MYHQIILTQSGSETKLKFCQKIEKLPNIFLPFFCFKYSLLLIKKMKLELNVLCIFNKIEWLILLFSSLKTIFVSFVDSVSVVDMQVIQVISNVHTLQKDKSSKVLWLDYILK